MTESEWLAATDPRPMLEYLRDRGGVSERNLRLLVVACCRRTTLPDEEAESVVEVAEDFADGSTSEAMLA